MKALATLLIFAGYTLVYAATARGGAFATEPWAGLFADAYGDLPIAGGTPAQNAAGIAAVTGQKNPSAIVQPSASGQLPGGVQLNTNPVNARRITLPQTGQLTQPRNGRLPGGVTLG